MLCQIASDEADDQTADVGAHVDAGDREAQDEVEHQYTSKLPEEMAEPIPEPVTMRQCVSGDRTEDPEDRSAGSHGEPLRVHRRRNGCPDNP